MPEIAFTRGMLTADFFTHSYRISGRIGVGASGIYGILGDKTSVYMELEDAYVSRINDPAKIVAHYALSALRKERISFIVLNRREEGVSVVRGVSYTQTGLPVFAPCLFEIRAKSRCSEIDTLTSVLVQARATSSRSSGDRLGLAVSDVGFTARPSSSPDAVGNLCATGVEAIRRIMAAPARIAEKHGYGNGLIIGDESTCCACCKSCSSAAATRRSCPATARMASVKPPNCTRTWPSST
jgi:hypothetical protein